MPLFPQGGGLYPDSIDNSILADMADGTVKGRALGAGAGNPMDLTPAQMQTLLGMTALLAGFPKLLQTQVAANSTQLDFTAFDNTKYGSYQLRGTGFTPGTDGQAAILRGSANGGASYDASANYPMTLHMIDSTGTASITGSNYTSFPIANSQKAGAGCIGFTADILPGQSTIVTITEFGYEQDAKWRGIRMMGAWANQTMNACRVLMTSGVIALGTASLYGFPK